MAYLYSLHHWILGCPILYTVKNQGFGRWVGMVQKAQTFVEHNSELVAPEKVGFKYRMWETECDYLQYPGILAHLRMVSIS